MSEYQEKAIQFLELFSAGNLQGLGDLLAEDFSLSGPLYQCTSKQQYLEILRNNPPEQCDFEVNRIIKDSDEVCLFYRLNKNQNAFVISQWFKFKNNKIVETELVFYNQPI